MLAMTLIGLSAFLIFELRTILLPLLVGAILAYLFRPIKNRFQIRWLPHELQVLLAFSIAVMLIVFGVSKAREMIPDEKGKLELKVRIKYKLNERYNQIVASGSGPVMNVLQKETQPLFNQINEWLSLNPAEQDSFLKYHRGYRGHPPIAERYFEYFKKTIHQDSLSSEVTVSKEDDLSKETGSHTVFETLETWILTPLIFIFLIFDNGQIRIALISLVPNRYFEMSLTMVDELDEAIGKYLRGTFLECSLVGLTMGLGLVLLGFPISVALFVAVISGMANAIPFLGPIIGLVISLAYALIAEDTVPLMPWLNADSLPIYVTILVGVTHLLDNILYSPIVLGGAVNLHPLVIIVAIASGSILLGFWGMLLAIPTVVIFKTGLETLVKELRAYRII
jgi:predicted PurR-regulated permease PerM